MKKSIFSSSLLLALLLASQALFAQVTTGTILGTVSDSTGAIIPGAMVTIRNVDTGITRNATTDASGRYRVPQLGLGSYEITAEATGFQTAVRSGITLTVGREALVDFTLQVGAVSEKITVTGEAPLVETTNATVSNLVDARSVRELPLNGRSLVDLTAIQPGVVLMTTISPSTFIGGAARMSIQGARPQQSTYLLDGLEISAPRFNTVPSSVLGKQLGVDGIREYSILTKNYGAQYGRAVGGVVNAVTQSGTNEFHGNLFEFLRNSALDARDFFANPIAAKPKLIYNQFGGSVGGPIRRDQTFFFLNYEGIKIREDLIDNKTVVDNLARQGIITDATGKVTSKLAVPSWAVPWLNLQVCPSTITGRLEPAQVNIPGLLPCPTDYVEKLSNGLARYAETRPRPAKENYGIARIDQKLSDKDSLFGRLTIDRSDRFKSLLFRTPGSGDLEEGGYLYASVQETRMISPAALNTVRLGYTRNHIAELEIYPPNLDPAMSCFYPDPVLSKAIPLCDMSVGGGAGIIGSGLEGEFYYISNTFDFSDSVNLTKGRHSIEFGGTARRYQMNEFQDTWQTGNISFNSYTDFLNDKANNILGVLAPADLYRGYRQTYAGLYLQDNFSVSPRLTLNLGLRWEHMTDPSEANGKIGTLRDVLNDTSYTLGQLFEVDDHLHGVQPRFGFAWTPLGNDRTVLRGGIGLFEELPLSYHYSLTTYVAPFAKRVTITNPPFPGPYANPKGTEEPVINAFDWVTAYSQQWNLVLQQQIGTNMMVSASYVGTTSKHLTGSYNPAVNVPHKDENGRWYNLATDTRPNPTFAGIRYQAPMGTSWYNGLLLEVEKRNSAGLQFKGSYTFSKNLDNTAIGTQGAEVPGSERRQYNSWDMGDAKALSQLHVHNQAVATFTYELPFGQGRRWWANVNGITNAFLGGWQLNGSTSIRNGLPLTVKIGYRNLPLAVSQTEKPDLRPGASNNPVLGDPAKYYDPTAFLDPGLGTYNPIPAGRFYYGNVGRDTLIGPGLVSQNFSIFKAFRISEGKRLQFRAEFFNLFNHPIFGIPNTTVFTAKGTYNPVAGQITATAVDNREIQFALKFEF